MSYSKTGLVPSSLIAKTDEWPLMSGQPMLTFLLDTNAVITLEPYAGSAEPNHESLAAFLVSARANAHRVAVHPANEDDLRQTTDDEHRVANLAALKKYELVAEPPIPGNFLQVASNPTAGTNDHRDLRLLAAVHHGAATHLVTSDERLIRLASRLDMTDRVLRPGEALELLRGLYPKDPPPPPRVLAIEPALLKLSDPIFDSLRLDYREFDQWFRTKVAPDGNRRAWVVVGEDGEYLAITIVKMKDDHPLDAGSKATKISTFKVDERAGGEKLGELLLKTVLQWAYEVRAQTLFVTVIEESGPKEILVHFLEQFGFLRRGELPDAAGEFIFQKDLKPDLQAALPPLDFHIRFGPPAVHPDSPVFVIPIQPRWYLGLFPDSPVFGTSTPLEGLVVETGPFGNALRKAYLSNASVRQIPAGAVILFYRSSDGRGSAGAVHAIGVVESTLRTSDPIEAMAFVGRRTVYDAGEIKAMCESGLIAVLFRQDRFLQEPWTLLELTRNGVLNGPPQAIVQVQNQGGRQWVMRQLTE